MKERKACNSCFLCINFLYTEPQPTMGKCAESKKGEIYNGIAWTCDDFKPYIPHYDLEYNGDVTRRPDPRIVKDIFSSIKKDN